MPLPRLLLGLFAGLLFHPEAWGYPEFIGYNYSSCLTCHFNGAGNGPLNDYGRALWAGEIAGRLWSGGLSDEKLAENSGFLGMKELPWWFRPGAAFRELIFQTDPPKGQSKTLLMQADINAAFFFDKDQKYAFIGSFGYLPMPDSLKNQPGPKPPSLITREHYLRIQASERWWVYTGFTNKVYGIRIVDHTAYSRSKTGMAENDQTYGAMIQYIHPKYEWTMHAFAGNLFQSADLRQVGASTLLEYEAAHAWRLGVTGLASANKYVGNTRFGLLSRLGLGFGSSIMAEAGIIDDKPKGSGEEKQGYYLYTQATQKVARGYHLFVVGQAYKDQLKGERPDNVRTTFGLMMFPRNLVEIRIDIEDTEQLTNSATVDPNSWAILAQLHLSI